MDDFTEFSAASDPTPPFDPPVPHLSAQTVYKQLNGGWIAIVLDREPDERSEFPFRGSSWIRADEDEKWTFTPYAAYDYTSERGANLISILNDSGIGTLADIVMMNPANIERYLDRNEYESVKGVIEAGRDSAIPEEFEAGEGCDCDGSNGTLKLAFAGFLDGLGVLKHGFDDQDDNGVPLYVAAVDDYVDAAIERPNRSVQSERLVQFLDEYEDGAHAWHPELDPRARQVKRTLAQKQSDVKASEEFYGVEDMGEVDTALIDRTLGPIKPNILTWDDFAVFYPGEINCIFGKSSTGKSMIARVTMLQEVRSGFEVVLVDLENSVHTIDTKLRQVGFTPEEIDTRVHVFRHVGPQSSREIEKLCRTREISLMVLDSFNRAVTVMDLDPNDTRGPATVANKVFKPALQHGTAIVYVDHVGHSEDSRLRPMNSVQKVNMCQGTMVRVDNFEPFKIGGEGRSTLVMYKDNQGSVEIDENKAIGDFVMSSQDDGFNVAWSISPVPLAPGKIKKGAALNPDGSVNFAAAARMAEDQEEEQNRTVQDIVQKLDAAGIDAGLSIRKARLAMKEANISATNAVLSNAQMLRRDRDRNQ